MHDFNRAFVNLALLVFMCENIASIQATEPRWAIEKRAGQFMIHCDAEFEVQDDLRLEMQQIESGLLRLLGIASLSQTVHVVLFGTEREYRRYMQHYFPKLPARRALFIQDRGPGMLFAHRHDDLRTDLRHECVHALLNTGARTVPLWLDEGLAEYFEVADDDQLTRHPHLIDVKQRTKMGFVPALEELEKLDAAELMGPGEYRDSWAWIHFLLHRNPATRELLGEYLKRLRSGDERLPLSKLIALQVPRWRTEFIEHFQALR